MITRISDLASGAAYLGIILALLFILREFYGTMVASLCLKARFKLIAVHKNGSICGRCQMHPFL